MDKAAFKIVCIFRIFPPPSTYQIVEPLDRGRPNEEERKREERREWVKLLKSHHITICYFDGISCSRSYRVQFCDFARGTQSPRGNKIRHYSARSFDNGGGKKEEGRNSPAIKVTDLASLAAARRTAAKSPF